MRFVDLQTDVTLGDLELAHREGFRSVEHVKRYTTLGMGTDQGRTGGIVGAALVARLDGRTLAQGGTTTFLAPALSMGAIGVLTLSGAPESHLGILSREFQIPCIMTTYLCGSDSRYVTGGNNGAHFAAVTAALNGKRVRLHCTDSDLGRVELLA